MANLADAYVQIIPSAKGIKGNITKEIGGECSAAGDAGGESLGKAMVSKIKGIVAAAGIGAMFKEAIEAGANLEQSFGGLDTIYEDAAGAAKAYAQEAAKAGISANNYAEQAVSFGASLKKALGGDVTQAAEMANMAIMDMADNAAKMGTPIESIQNAYQGLAKGNATMLDNLKIGYGGTQTEMLELAKDMGVIDESIKSFGDMSFDESILAIHKMQEELHITGVAADEAASTVSGSMGAMKAAVENVMANIATGQDGSIIYDSIQTLMQNAEAFIFDNLAPMAGRIIGRVPQIIANLLYEIGGIMREQAANMPSMVDFGVEFVTGLIDSIVQNAGEFVAGAGALISSLVDTLLNYDWAGTMDSFMSRLSGSLSESAYSMFGDYDADIIENLLKSITNFLPKLAELGTNMLHSIGEGLKTAIPALLENVLPMIMELTGSIRENFGTLVDAGIDMLISLAEGLIEGLPTMIETIPTIISNICGLINDNMPKILKAGVEILVMLVKGIIDSIPVIIRELPKIVGAIIDFISATNWINLGKTIIKDLASGIGSMVGNIKESASNLLKKLVETFKNHDWISLGKNIIDGILQGLKNAASKLLSYIWDLCKSMLSSVKDFFQIGSPSKVMRDQIGKWIPEGMAVGIEANVDSVANAMSSLSKQTTQSIDGLNLGKISVQNSAINKTEVPNDLGTSMSKAIISALEGMSVTMDGQKVGKLVARPVNEAIGGFALRRV